MLTGTHLKAELKKIEEISATQTNVFERCILKGVYLLAMLLKDIRTNQVTLIEHFCGKDVMKKK